MAELSADDLARGRALLAEAFDDLGAALTWSQWCDDNAPALLTLAEQGLSAASSLAALKAQIRQKLEDAVRDLDMADHLEQHAATDPPAWRGSARLYLTQALALLQQPEPPQERER